MDLDEIESLNEIRPAVYRAALKLRSLQKLCHMHMVTLSNLQPVLCAVGASKKRDCTEKVSQDHLWQKLEQVFQCVLKEQPGHVVQATDQTTGLLFKLYDRGKTGFVSQQSVEAAMIVLSGDTLSAKHRALIQLAAEYSKGQNTKRTHINRNGLRVLFDDLSQVPAVVQESHVFGPVELAMQSCFKGVITEDASEEHFVSWLQSEPRLLLWLSTLYRVSISEAVQHRVRCHVCKGFPITGLRYRCLKCINVHLCQSCFLTERRMRKHKPSHPVLEYCTQPTWKESMASLASSARYILLSRGSTRREMERRQAIRSKTKSEPQFSAPDLEQQQAHGNNFESLNVILDATVPPSFLQHSVESIALQTDDTEPHCQRKASLLLKDLSITQKTMRDLQRDKWLLEKEFQVWKLATESEHDALEDRCTELEATMNILMEHNQQMEEELRQVQYVLRMKDTNDLDNESHASSQRNRADLSDECPLSISPESHISSTLQEGGCLERKDENNKNEVFYHMQGDQDIHLVLTENCGIKTQNQVNAVTESGMCFNNQDNRQEKEKEEEKKDDRNCRENEIAHDTNDEKWNKMVNNENEEREEEDSDEPRIEEDNKDKKEENINAKENIGESTVEMQELVRNPLLEDFVQEKTYMVDKSAVEVEEELCILVQRLQESLLLPTPPESVFLHKQDLLQAAEKVGDSIFHFVTSIQSFTLSSSQDPE